MDWTQHRREVHGIRPSQDYLKQVVYGGNDGIVTTFAIVAGFAGASLEGVAQIGGIAVLVFGLANLFADGVSMGLGEFLSSRSESDLYHKQHREEIQELKNDPEGERKELEAILTERGVPKGDAIPMAALLSDHPEITADLMMTYEFDMTRPNPEGAAVNGFVTFLAFITFGFVPLVPYVALAPTPQTFNLSLAATTFALFALGSLRWHATGERPGRAIGETMTVGGICSAVAFLVGWIVGG